MGGQRSRRGVHGAVSGGVSRHLRDRRDELVTAAPDGLDGLLELAAVAKDPARTLDMVAERGVGDFAPVPDCVEQLLAGQHAVPVADQVHQQVEDLGLHGDDVGAAADPVPGRIDDVVADLVLLAIHRKHPTPPVAAAVVESLSNRYRRLKRLSPRPADNSGAPGKRQHWESNMPTPLEILLDPVSLAVLGIYGALILLEALFPARPLPRVRGWRTRALVVFAVYFFMSSYLPLLWGESLARFQVFDLQVANPFVGAAIAVLIYELLVYVVAPRHAQEPLAVARLPPDAPQRGTSGQLRGVLLQPAGYRRLYLAQQHRAERRGTARAGHHVLPLRDDVPGRHPARQHPYPAVAGLHRAATRESQRAPWARHPPLQLLRPAAVRHRLRHLSQSQGLRCRERLRGRLVGADRADADVQGYRCQRVRAVRAAPRGRCASPARADGISAAPWRFLSSSGARRVCRRKHAHAPSANAAESPSARGLP